MKKLFYYKKSKLVSAIIYGFIIGLAVTCKCYAGTTAIRMIVDCVTNTSGPVKIGSYPGRPDTQLSLITNGIRIVETRDIIAAWNPHVIGDLDPLIHNDLNKITVEAECVKYAHGRMERDVDFTYIDMWPPGPPLICKKGEGIKVEMYSTEDRHYGMYRYDATLIINQDEPKKPALLPKNITESDRIGELSFASDSSAHSELGYSLSQYSR